jgi:hypothetical protein
MQPNDTTLCWYFYELNSRGIETQAVFMPVALTVHNKTSNRCHTLMISHSNDQMAAPKAFSVL